MHHIQIKILQRLLYAAALNYAAMRPAGVESNHFAYHLEQLLKSKLVIKDGKLYRLSPTGVAFVDGLSQATMVYRQQPFIVTAIDLTAPSGRTLLFKRNFHPYFGLAGFPMGKLHLDESITAAAQRELLEKTGIRNVPLTHRGMAYVEGRQDGQLISKLLYHIFSGSISTEVDTATPQSRGNCFWAIAETVPRPELMPGFMELKNLLASNTGWFFEELTAEVG